MHVGFDIGGTNARASLYDADWNEAATLRERVRERTGPDEVAGLVASMLVELFEATDVEALHGIGIGLAGQLSSDRRVVRNAPNLGWRDEPFADRVEQALDEAVGQPHVVLVNDLNGLLWGEYVAGAVAEVDDALAVYAGTGVGGAVLADGELVVGAEGVAGEIGHSKVVPGGRLCGCGERGCVEAYAGGIHLERRVARIAHRADGALDEVFVDADAEEVDLTAADALADEHEGLDELWREATDYLALVTANACTLLNPGVLLVGGGVVEHCPGFRDRYLSKTTPLILEVARESLEIRSPQLGDDGGKLGAARLASREAKLRESNNE